MNMQMHLVGESIFSHAVGQVVVRYNADGMVSPLWLSACKEERNLTKGLMEKIAEPSNLWKAFKRVRTNDGSHGVDNMPVKELGKWLKANYQQLQSSLIAGNYQPGTVRGVQIPKPQGGYRQLGIPTVKDRLVQQAIHQVLSEKYERIFSTHSYGFRPGKYAHQALKQAGEYIALGKSYVIYLDLEKFFDEVNHHRLMWLLKTQIGDTRLLKLIDLFLKAGMLQGGLMSQRIKGTPQGGPLSPLLSNIILDELDKELEKRGHSYVRYADDVKIFVSSEAAAGRVKESITKYIEGKLLLKVNKEKSRISQGYELNFLGHGILKEGKLMLSYKSEERLREEVRHLTRRNRGISMAQMVKELRIKLQGWLQYFRYAAMRKRMERIDSWIKHRLRCHRLKQCKRVIGIVRWLRKCKIEETLCWRTALSGKGWWRLSNSPAANIGMNNLWFAENGYYSLADNYQSLHRKSL